jgi:hypothetical protein
VRERQPRRVEELALEADLVRTPVDRVARDRQVDRREMTRIWCVRPVSSLTSSRAWRG